jgi:DNA-binding response OmpR family regulator
MDAAKFIRGKKILIVDDEPDVLSQLVELLDMCRIDTALSFDEGKKRLESEPYDIAILDIMGVDGFELLKVANQYKIPVIMLTAHGLSEENLKRCVEQGACYYAPKEKMFEIDLFVADVLEAIDADKSPWEKWMERLAGYYDKRFHGTNWREQQKEFLENAINKYV